MQYKIPQNVGIEDKIVGPLTLRQLIILAVGFGVSYVLFSILSKLYELNILEYIIIVLPALIAVAFALIKINDIKLPKFILLFLEFAIKPKKRVWDHRGIAPLVSPDLGEQKEEAEATPLDEKTKKTANLKELTQVLDTGGFEHLESIEHEKIDEAQEDDLVSEAYFGHKDSSTENMYWRTKKSHKKMLDLFAKLPITKVKKGTKETEIMRKEIEEIKQETEALKKKPEPQATTRTVPSPNTSQALADQAAKQKPRKRSRKRKRKIPQPVRANNNIDTTTKNKPAKFIPKSPPAKKAEKASRPEANPPRAEKEGEFKFEELKKGEIEINLD